MKTCKSCKELKPLDQYRARRNACNGCVNEAARTGPPDKRPFIVAFPLWPPPAEAAPPRGRNRGEANGRAKLTLTQVANIRKRLAEGASHAAVAREYCVDKSTVTRINKGQAWGPAPNQRGKGK
jgi:hypothetical protein